MLDNPPADENGVVPHDHAQIEGADRIIRRVSFHHLVQKDDGTYRISSAVLSQSGDRHRGCSINIGKIIEHLGEAIEDYCRQRGDIIGAISFSAADIRAKEAKVGYEPLEEDPAHGEIWGLKSKSKKRALLRQLEIEFSDYEISD